MAEVTRRTFLKDTGKAAAALTAAEVMLAPGWAQTSLPPTRVVIDSARSIGPIDRNVFGSFLEHLGRAIYEGVYDPKSSFADANGFRTDVIKQVKTLGVPIVRYPGGNFVSGYNWLDGIGPKEDRPHVLDRAWNTMESNQFGTNEFITWARTVGAEPLLGMNFGTGSAEGAAALVEYCNVPSGTKWSNLRRQHGYEQPHNVQFWCLGNEMDGTWQIGHMTGREYGKKAADAARQMRVLDPAIKLIACGSTAPWMETYLEWDREVLEECYELVDGISLHRYYDNSNETNGDSSRYLAMNLDMDRQIEEIQAISDVVRGRKRSRKTLFLSFDEWNVWYRARSGDFTDGKRTYAPHLLEEVYNLEDALLVGGLLNSLIRHADRVKIGCLAQLVNVIAPIMTNQNGLVRQTILYPYAWALQYARGTALSLAPEGPTYRIQPMAAPASSMAAPLLLNVIPYIDVVATLDSENRSVALFILNRDLEKAREVEFNWHDLSPTKVNACQTITGSDLKASNTFEQPSRVVPQAVEPPKLGSRMIFQAPPRSYTIISLSI